METMDIHVHVKYRQLEVISDFRLSRKFTADIDSPLESLHAVDMDNIADVWEVNTASVFKVEGQFDKLSLPLPLLALNGHQATPFPVVLLVSLHP